MTRGERPTGSRATAPPGSQAPTPPPTGWDPATLAPMESALTRFMGPMAKVLVRKAARDAHDLRALQDALAQQIPDATDRARFTAMLAAGGGTAVTQVLPRGPGTGGTGGSSGFTTVGATQLQGEQPISPELTEHARQVLARHVGPIAKVVLRKALLSARSPDQLFEAVLREVGDQADRGKLLEDLRRKPK